MAKIPYLCIQQADHGLDLFCVLGSHAKCQATLSAGRNPGLVHKKHKTIKQVIKTRDISGVMLLSLGRVPG